MNRLILPIESYRVSDEHWKFGDKVPRRFGLWARHLGDDIIVEPGTQVVAIGEGEVVFSETLAGSEKHRSWGGVIVLKHDKAESTDLHKVQTKPKAQNTKTQTFYSVYGHMRALKVNAGENVEAGEELGVIAGSYTPENGWWKIPHLHFGIYTGPWRGNILPGYWRPEKFWRTHLAWWHDPRGFIAKYNNNDGH